MTAATADASEGSAIAHSATFKRRRFLNWFPLGLTYAFLYMARYNLTVAKNALGSHMTKEDFGLIFGAGTITYAVSFLLNGPMIERIGGRKGMLIAAAGTTVANLAMAAYLLHIMGSGQADTAPLTVVFSVLYAANMYFQSFGAVSIVKVNSNWFHVTERGGFSGIFGTMISSGIFLAFTVNGWLMDLGEVIYGEHTPAAERAWIVFAIPAVLLALMWVAEYFLLRDRPSEAGQEDFDTGAGKLGEEEEDDKPLPTLVLFKKIFTHPIIMTVAFIELCTGVVRQGVMQWFKIYSQEVWALPSDHLLMRGSWEHYGLIAGCFAVAAVSGVIASRTKGKRRAYLVIFAGLAFLVPFFQGGWGGLLMVAGVIGGNLAGWVSDIFFQSRRGPAAGGLYLLMAVCAVGMAFTLSPPTNQVEEAAESSGLLAGDQIVSIAGEDGIDSWDGVRRAVACWQPVCVDSVWDAQECMCRTRQASGGGGEASVEEGRTIPAVVLREGERVELALADPKSSQRAGDRRLISARPVLPISPFYLGVFLFLMSLGVIGTHGLLSGTATMDFGGKKGTATTVGVIDGFVYLGTAIQSFSLGYLTTRSWSYWPWFLLPFTVIGFLLCLRIWNATPRGKGKGGH